MKSKIPSISVCMSTLNEVANGTVAKNYIDSTLGLAIDSLCQQSLKSWELIIVGDKTDYEQEINTLVRHIESRLQQTHPEATIRFFNLDQPGGGRFPGVRPKQQAIAESTSNILAFLDPDNIYSDPNHLRRCRSLLEEKTDIDLIYCNSILECKPSGFFRLPIPWKRYAWSPKTKKRLMKSNFIDMSDAVFRKKAYKKAGGLKETIPYAMDWQLWRDMITVGSARFLHSPHFGIRYRTGTLNHHIEMIMTSIAERLQIPYSLEYIINKKQKKLKKMTNKLQEKFIT